MKKGTIILVLFALAMLNSFKIVAQEKVPLDTNSANTLIQKPSKTNVQNNIKQDINATKPVKLAEQPITTDTIVPKPPTSTTPISEPAKTTGPLLCDEDLIYEMTSDANYVNIMVKDYSESIYFISGFGEANTSAESKAEAVLDAKRQLFRFVYKKKAKQYVYLSDAALEKYIDNLIKIDMSDEEACFWGKTKNEKRKIDGREIVFYTSTFNIVKAKVNESAIKDFAKQIDEFISTYPVVFMFNPRLLENTDGISDKAKKNETILNKQLYKEATDKIHDKFSETKCHFNNVKKLDLYPPCELDEETKYNPCEDDVFYFKTGNKYLDYVNCLAKDWDITPEVLISIDTIKSRSLDIAGTKWNVSIGICAFYISTKTEIFYDVPEANIAANSSRDATLKAIPIIFDSTRINEYMTEFTSRYMNYIYGGSTFELKICNECLDSNMDDFIDNIKSCKYFNIITDRTWNVRSKAVGRYMEGQSYILNPSKLKDKLLKFLKVNGVDKNVCELKNTGGNFYITKKNPK